MFKKLLAVLSIFILSIGFAFAGVDVNKADQAALDGIKGIGPATSKAIVDARSKGGNFKDWSDFESRVKGVGEKSAAKLSEAGLTVNGQSKAGASEKMPAPEKVSKKAEAKTETKTETKAGVEAKTEMKAATKTEAKAEVKTKAEKKAEAKMKKEAKLAEQAAAKASASASTSK